MKRRSLTRAAVLLSAALPFFPPEASADEVCQEECKVIHTFEGTGDDAGLFGWAVSELTDVDGDGATDFITGSILSTAGGTRAGRAYVYSSRSGARLYTFTGEASDLLGYAVADAGLVDGDGVHDVLVGAPGVASIKAGRAILFSGATGEVIRVLTGEAVGDRFGAAVAGAGDVDGDGYDDVLVGAPYNDHLGNSSGRAYLYSGHDGTLIRVFDAENAGAGFGSSVAQVGDVDHDGIPDQVVGAPGGGPEYFGKAYVYSGADGNLLYDVESAPDGIAYGVFFSAGPGDVDGDGTPDLYVADYGYNSGDGRAYVYSGIDGALIYDFQGVDLEGLGPGRGAGDVNGDGHADLIIGAYTNSEGADQAGKAYVYSGKNGALLWTFTSTTPGEQRGFDAIGLGDVNGDSKIDFLVSAASGNRIYLFAGTRKVKEK